MIALSLLAISSKAISQRFHSAKAILTNYQNIEDLHNYEKLYLHTDKSVYEAPGYIWFSAYLVDAATNQPFQNTTVYVTMVGEGEKEYMRQQIEVKDGIGRGCIWLDTVLVEGSYTLCAHTLNMASFDPQYFFRKSLFIHSEMRKAHPQMYAPTDKKRVNLGFFPEGGNLVADIESKVAFKAVDQSGHPVKVQGKIVDRKNHSICDFKSVHNGHGCFKLKPKSKMKYRALVSYGGEEYKFDLPESISQGYQISVTNQAKSVLVHVANTPDMELDSCFVIAQCKYFQGIWGWRCKYVLRDPQRSCAVMY